jgi:hypothetical protein
VFRTVSYPKHLTDPLVTMSFVHKQWKEKQCVFFPLSFPGKNMRKQRHRVAIIILHGIITYWCYLNILMLQGNTA